MTAKPALKARVADETKAYGPRPPGNYSLAIKAKAMLSAIQGELAPWLCGII